MAAALFSSLFFPSFEFGGLFQWLLLLLPIYYYLLLSTYLHYFQ
jgi:hypothetical protein